MLTHVLDRPAARWFRQRIRRKIAVGTMAIAGALAIPGVAQADWYLSKYSAERMAKRYVAYHYADTYVSDLTTVCRPQGARYNPAYEYHRWVCGWYDSSDDSSGVVLIVGVSGGGASGRVLVPAH